MSDCTLIFSQFNIRNRLDQIRNKMFLFVQTQIQICNLLVSLQIIFKNVVQNLDASNGAILRVWIDVKRFKQRARHGSKIEVQCVTEVVSHHHVEICRVVVS
jgi:hypothetical protein